DPDFAEAITVTVARIDQNALGRIIDLLLERQDVESRVRVVHTLGGLRSLQPMRLLETLFQDNAPEVRAVAAEVLGRTHLPRSGILLLSGLTDPDEIVRARSVDALVRLDHGDAGARILELLASDPSADVRERAALATG